MASAADLPNDLESLKQLVLQQRAAIELARAELVDVQLAFTGVLQADGYAGFDRLYGQRIQEAACWAHVRRKFYDIHVALDSTRSRPRSVGAPPMNAARLAKLALVPR